MCVWLRIWLGVGPGVVEVAGDADVFGRLCGAGEGGGEGVAVERGEALLEDVGGGVAGGEGDGVGAEFALGEVEDRAVDEVLVEECAVDVAAAFEEHAVDVAFGEVVEQGAGAGGVR